ncbi:MAG: ATP-binding protein [Verrucomicrobia bacterium]|jgi:signal transduction histidine kinase|nr:ATP-binding protein [Verrucomicrobiota bacterium]
MPEPTSADALSQRWRGLFEVFQAPPADPTLFRKRIRFVERNIGIWVKLMLAPVIYWFLFNPHAFGSVSVPREDVLAYLQTFTLMMTAVNIGSGILLWGMDEISTPILERVVSMTSLLDTAFLAALTLFCGGFDSILYWVFLGLVIRNAAIIPRSEVQVLVNLFVCALYVLSGVLEMRLGLVETQVLDSYTPKLESSGGLPEAVSEPFESLVLRVLLLLLMTVVCLGLQILIDRQRQREAETQEFALKQEQLEAAGRLAAEIAHQLKNPLGIINNAAYTLQKTVREGKTITQQIAIIREEVARSDRIITDLMGYARLVEGRVERLTIAEILEQSLAIALPLGAGFPIQVHLDIPPALPVLLGQRGHFMEIFTNLLVNAREAMGQKGQIWITARPAPDYAIQVTVRDSGPGIPAEVIGRIWESYFTTKDRGTGLGLTIVKHTSEMYGGRVRVESDLGKGATFTITLPARTLMRLR